MIEETARALADIWASFIDRILAGGWLLLAAAGVVVLACRAAEVRTARR